MFDLSILLQSSFLVVAAATVLLAACAAIVGSVSVLKGQSLIGDAIGHAAFPGVVLAFMFSLQRNPPILLLGASLSGCLAFYFISSAKKHSKLAFDAILAIVLAAFFGLGMVLKGHIQGHAAYQKASQSGLQTYIFGQASYIMKIDLYLILWVTLPCLLLFFIFFKEIKLFIFDETYARTIGMKCNVVNILILIMTMGIISCGLKLVGTILISSLLIVPTIIASQWSQRYSMVLLIAALSAALSAFLGSYFSSVITGMSTGPTIIVIMSILAFFSLAFGKNKFRKRSLRTKMELSRHE